LEHVGIEKVEQLFQGHALRSGKSRVGFCHPAGLPDGFSAGPIMNRLSPQALANAKHKSRINAAQTGSCIKHGNG
jgi:hypothetical protein